MSQSTNQWQPPSPFNSEKVKKVCIQLIFLANNYANCFLVTLSPIWKMLTQIINMSALENKCIVNTWVLGLWNQHSLYRIWSLKPLFRLLMRICPQFHSPTWRKQLKNIGKIPPLLSKTLLIHLLPREEGTIQYCLMVNVAIKAMSEFPDIREDFVWVDNGVKDASKDIALKLKQVHYWPSQLMHAYICQCMLHICTLLVVPYPQITWGMKAACQVNTCMLKSAILGLAKEYAAWLGYTLDMALQKNQHGINNEGTACLFLPYRHIEDCFSDPDKWVCSVVILKSKDFTCLL